MSAPSNIRVEATSITTTMLRWAYAGSNQIAVYRSTDGSSYSEITSAGSRVAVGTTSYTDTGLSVGTKYYYKLSDDVGSTFSSVVTVWTHSCVGPIGFSSKPVELPRFDEDEVATMLGDTSQIPGGPLLKIDDTTERLNEMARRIEQAFAGKEVEPDQCVACPSDGALVIDCSDGCKNWTVALEDGDNINSVSINWCDKFDGTIDFVIPPNATVAICGLPAGFGFSGDECTQAPINGGSNGRTLSLGYGGGGAGGGRASPTTSSRPGTNKGVGNGIGTGGGGGSGCTCVPGQNGQLTIKSCNANNSLACSSGKSNKLITCGGRGPYTWSKTGSVNLSDTSGPSTMVTPPTNAGSGVAGAAYWITCWTCNGANCLAGVCASIIRAFTAIYGCDDSWAGDPGGCSSTDNCLPAPAATETNKCCSNNTNQCSNNTCIDLRQGGCTGVTTTCDKRTAPMISNGCNPCGLHAGATVTVTDAFGTQATIILRA